MSDKKFLDQNGLLYVWQKIKTLLGGKVDKVDGKSLISDTEITRLASVTNYDDKEVQAAITNLETKVSALESGTYDDTQLRKDIADTYATLTALADHTGNTTIHVTSAEKTKLSGIASGAQVNVIESIKVNGTAATITSKSVNITVPTDNKSLTNGAGYQTADNVSTAIANALKDVTSIEYKKLTTGEYDASTLVPTVTGATGVIYLVPKTTSETNNVYVEWIWDGTEFEKIGDTTVDLSGYISDEDVISNSEIDTIFSA